MEQKDNPREKIRSGRVRERKLAEPEGSGATATVQLSGGER